jgi:hypothetical protein
MTISGTISGGLEAIFDKFFVLNENPLCKWFLQFLFDLSNELMNKLRCLDVWLNPCVFETQFLELIPSPISVMMVLIMGILVLFLFQPVGVFCVCVFDHAIPYTHIWAISTLV